MSDDGAQLQQQGRVAACTLQRVQLTSHRRVQLELIDCTTARARYEQREPRGK